MSYWRCNPETQIFSKKQVEVMNSFLRDPHRSSKYRYIKKGRRIIDQGIWSYVPKRRYFPIGPQELMNIAKKLKKENPKAYALQFEPKPFFGCGAKPQLSVRSIRR